ncbi:MAG: 2'-5' RNA ligase family protein [Candidatus Ozemobacteraceae bacterium]
MPCAEFQPLPYTVAFLLPQEILHFVTVQRRRLSDCCRRFDPLETLHLTIKYLGYPSEDFPEKFAIQLIPRIADILRPFVPVKVAIRGIDLFWAGPGQPPVAYLKVLSVEQLRFMHEALTSGLGNDIECFPHADGKNFKPHITISKHVEEREIERVLRLIYRSRKTAKRDFTLANVVLFTPNATYPIFPAPFSLLRQVGENGDKKCDKNAFSPGEI